VLSKKNTHTTFWLFRNLLINFILKDWLKNSYDAYLPQRRDDKNSVKISINDILQSKHVRSYLPLLRKRLVSSFSKEQKGQNCALLFALFVPGSVWTTPLTYKGLAELEFTRFLGSTGFFQDGSNFTRIVSQIEEANLLLCWVNFRLSKAKRAALCAENSNYKPSE
jgi:hypothetical protein